MVLSSRNRMNALIHKHVEYNPKEFVFRIGDAQRDNNMGRIGPEIQIHVQI